MWGPGGHAYVYFVYGMHHCLNVVTKEEGEPEAVLIRAGVPEDDPASRVASGPAKLCRYLGITTELSGTLLAGPSLFLFSPSNEFGALPRLVGPRVGVAYAGEAARWPLRFAVAGCPAVTRPGALRPL